MTRDAPQSDPAPILGAALSRTPTAHLGVAVVNDLLTAIVSGEIPPGDTLPSQERLAQQFGVSRTVIRESVKRIEEKGLITLESGRGTTVQPSASWNMLHPAVLSVML